MYAVIDVETTGLSPRKDKITEIALFLTDGKRIIEEYSTLINPERPIPYYITRMTGISDEMVAGAPKFYEIAKTLVEMTDDTVFTAHNARFDYGFIREEFLRLGYRYERELIDTVRLSRRLLPGHRSYSLGKLCADIGIDINGRHRASGDALATAYLLHHLLELDR